MVTQSTLKGWARAAGCFGVVLLLPLNAGAADTAARVISVQPITTIKPVQAPPVVKAPPVTMPRPDPLPVMTKPIAIQPITPGPIAVQPVRIVKPEVSLTPIAPKTPATPIGKVDAAAPKLDGGITSSLMQVQKAAAKEAREDHRLARDEKNLTNAAKAEKLKRDNDAIRNGMDESREKADNAMDAAQTGMVVGIVSGGAQVGAGAVSQVGKAGKNANLDKDSDSRKDGLEDKIGKMDGQQGRLKKQADKLNKTSEKMTELQPQLMDAGTGDLESQVQKVMLESQRQSNADLKQQLKEVKDANTRKQALRDAAKDSHDARGKDDGKGGKTVAAVPVTAAGAVPPKTSLISRPCTPINPC